MALVDDVVAVVSLASAAFFVVLSLGLLVRYKQVSQRISASSDMGRDLWQALEQRMKKQDERILDVMGRLEVVQARVVASAATQPPAPREVGPLQRPPAPRPASLPSNEEAEAVTQRVDTQHSESQVTAGKSQGSQRAPAPTPVPRALDETHLAAIRLLGEGPKSTRQLTDALGKSREHTARMMKGLFEMGLVSRNASTKPFVYQLTDDGRRQLRSS